MKHPRKSKAALDPQAETLYGWEDQWLEWNRKQIALSDCRALVVRACDLYEIDPPTLLSYSGKYSYYHSGEHRIYLLEEHQNIARTLHETAHAIVVARAARSQDHGPTFAGVYLYLLINIEMCPAAAIYASARKAGIRWNRKATPDGLELA